MSLSNYKYKKLRKMVRESGIGSGGQELFNCALRQYKKGVQEPAKGTYLDGNKACLIGAAVSDALSRGRKFDFPTDWQINAVKEFGITYNSASNIIAGFDGDSIGNSKYAKLARNIGLELGLRYED